MSFTAPESLSEQIAKYLAASIISGKMTPGERIQEARVVNELSVSRGSVREALLILERRYLINILPRRGAVVAELSEENVSQLYDLYINLLVMLAVRVADNWQDDALDPVLSEWEKMRDCNQNEDRAAFVAAGFRLMHEACQIARNDYLSEILSNLQPALHRAYALGVRYRPAEVSHAFRFFAELIQAVARRDRNAIPTIIKAYGKHQCSTVLAALAEETSACA